MHVIVPKVLELILAGIMSGSELVSSPNRDPDSRDQRTRSITMYVCMHVIVYICMHVCMYVCMHVCMYVYTYVCMYACI